MIEAQKYTNNFFTNLERESFQSAKAVVPIVNRFIKPASVVDIGCGTGMWLKAWYEDIGVKDILGVEGPYVKSEMIKAPADKIIFKDLKNKLDIGRQFDLAMSLEVAEHLPANSAETFIQTLTDLSDIVLFSAAIPEQGGTYHINEQFPEYWAIIFKKFGYVAVDCIRPEIYNNPRVEWWYQQNILLFVKAGIIDNNSELSKYMQSTQPGYLSRVHPVLYGLKVAQVKRTETIWGFINWKWYMFKRKYLKKNAA